MSNLDALTPWALLVMALLNIGALLKVLAPRLFDAFITRQEQTYEAGRQDNITQWANMVALQKEIVGQNNRLVEFFIANFKADISGLQQAMASLNDRLSSELKDIDGRWLASTKQAQQLAAQHSVLIAELSDLNDLIHRFERQLNYVVVCIPEIVGESREKVPPFDSQAISGGRRD